METKLCRKCNLEKDIDDFRLKKDKCGKYYRYSYCKQCEKEYAISKIGKQRKKGVDKAYRIRHKKEIYYRFNKRKKEDKIFKLKCQVRTMLWISFNKKSKLKSDKSEQILGCNIEHFANYLLQTYKNNYGYEWDGIEPVHIDHIKPLKYADTEEEIIKLCHYTNLQLLKEKDNLEKGSQLNWKLN